MKNPLQLSLLLSALMLATAVRAQASTEISNLGQPAAGGFLGQGFVDVGLEGGIPNTVSVAFTTGNASSYLSSISVLLSGSYVYYMNSFQGSFTLALYSDSSGSPGTLLETLSGNSSPTSAGTYVYADTASEVLSANTTYWIVASDTSYGGEAYYQWSTAGNATLDGGSVWTLGAAQQSEGDSIGGYPQFNVVVQSAPAQATITVQSSPSNEGTVGGGGTFNVGTSVQISATPNSGYVFTGWNDSNTNNPRTITVTAGGATYTASFETAPTTTTEISNLGQPSSGGFAEQGFVDVGLEGGIPNNVSVAFTTGNASSYLSSISVLLSGSYVYFMNSFQGAFTLALYSDSSGSPGSLLETLSGNSSPVSAGTYVYADTASEVLSANTTYWIVVSDTSYGGEAYYQWSTAGNATLDGGSVWTLGAAQQSEGDSIGGYPQFNVVVQPAPTQATITVQASPSNEGTVGGGGTFNIGTSVQISATPNSEYAFTGWNDSNTNNPRTITVTAGGATYTAGFETAPTTVTEISNLGQPSTGGFEGQGFVDVGLEGGIPNNVSVAFTTGSASSYLSSISVLLSGSYVYFMNSFQGAFTLALYSNASGSPGSLLETLSGNGSPASAGTYTYADTASEVLSANTTYWIVASDSSYGGEAYYQWSTAGNATLDGGSAWTLGGAQQTEGDSIGGYPQFNVVVQPAATITVQASPSNEGTVSGGGFFNVGTSVQISATPNSGYVFTGWNDGDMDASRTITVTADGATYTANFAALLTISFSGSSSALISWPVTDGLVLQQSSSLAAGSWTTSGATITTNGPMASVTVPSASGYLFFRLGNP